MTRRVLTTSAAAVAFLSLAAGPAFAAPEVDGYLGTDGAAHMAAGESEERAKNNREIPPELRIAEYQRAPYCREAAGRWVMGLTDGTCPDGANLARTAVQCDEGDTLVMPMWMRERATPASPWGEWDDIDPGGCGVDLLPVLTQADFRRLPIPAPVLTLQPDRGWVLVNIETIVRTDPTPVTLRTELLGYGITVEVTPTLWTYDFGDGHTLTTESPGHPYPDHDTFHEYEKPDPARTITLTAQWTGRYQVDGSPVWRDVDGVALTTTTSAPFRVEERISRLVDGLCTDKPKPPDC